MSTHHDLNRHYSQRRLETMVENRTIYSLDQAELNIYETRQQAEKVELQFGDPVLASMLTGKKVMHLRQDNIFDFFPGESVILPADELMRIDFPEATHDAPTQCLALALSSDHINKTVDFLNETTPKAEDGSEWSFIDYNFHFTNDIAIHQIIGRLIFLFTENHPSKGLFADYMLKELIIRLMQTQARRLLIDHSSLNEDTNRLAYIINFIRRNLHESLTVEQLSRKACMSQSHFFRCFKNEFGFSPVDFINKERIRMAADLLKNPRKSVTDACFESGFISYFTRLFKRYTQMTPKQYQLKHVQLSH
jgi:AraC-like DNA-binding protein